MLIIKIREFFQAINSNQKEVPLNKGKKEKGSGEEKREGAGESIQYQRHFTRRGKNPYN